jgi:thioesterase domain-containing protein
MPQIFEISMDGPIDPCEVAGVGVVGINLGGSLPPLFCVRTWSEELEGYRRLARHLGPEQPIYSVSPPAGSKRSDFPANTDQWADFFSARFGDLLERESIALIGWSYAGVVALRMADKLAERGVRVRLVNLIDSTLPLQKPRGDSRKRSEPHRLVVMLERLFQLDSRQARLLYARRYAGKLVKRTFKRVMRRLKALIRASRPPEIASEGAASSIRNRGGRERRMPLLMRAIRVAYLKHEVRPTALPVALYWCEASRRRLGDAGLGWTRCLLGDFASRQIEGTHHTLFEEPHVERLARLLSCALRNAWENEQAAVASPSASGWRSLAPAPPTDTASPRSEAQLRSV